MPAKRQGKSPTKQQQAQQAEEAKKPDAGEAGDGEKNAEAWSMPAFPKDSGTCSTDFKKDYAYLCCWIDVPEEIAPPPEEEEQ